MGAGGVAPTTSGRGANGEDSTVSFGAQTLVRADGGGGGGAGGGNRTAQAGGSGGGGGEEFTNGAASTSGISLSVPSAMSIGQGTNGISSVIFTGTPLGSSSLQRTLTLRLVPLNASDTTALGTLSATNLGTDVTATAEATNVTELTLTGTASKLSSYLSAVGGNLKFNGDGRGTLRNLQLTVSNATGSTVSTQILLGQLGPTAATGSTSLSLPGTVRTTPGATVAIPIGSQALVAPGPVTLTFSTSGGASLAWSAGSDLKVSSAVGAGTLDAGSGSSITIYGTSSAINSYLAAGNLRAGGTGTVNVTGAVAGSIAVAEQTNSSASIQAPTLNLPSGLSVSSQSGQVIFPPDALGTGTAVRTAVIQVSNGTLGAAANASVGLSSSVTAAGQVSLTGTEAALSTYLAAAGNLTFQGDAGTYSLSVSVQGQASSVTFSGTRTVNLLAIAPAVVTLGSSAATAVSPLITQLPTRG